MVQFQDVARRDVLTLIAGAGGFAASAAAAQPSDPMGSRTMMDDVRAYDALGEHRTATPTDNATSAWLARRLGAAGFQTSLQGFQAPSFMPLRGELRVAGEVAPAFPAWPVVATGGDGATGPLTPHDAPDLGGKLALVRLRHGGGDWGAPGAGDVVMQAAQRGPKAVVVVTEGPTGEIIALNAVPSRFAWPVPVAIVGGRYGDRLSGLASEGGAATLVSVGRLDPAAQASNVIARRPGRGKTIVVTTPKSGWFHCAGERGTGIAIFLHLAAWLARQNDHDLLFVAFAGHELGYMGGAQFMRESPPPPDQVRAWLHIGANAAMPDLAVTQGVIAAQESSKPFRRAAASPAALDAAQQAFLPDAGYGPALPFTTANAVGELSLIWTVGYRNLAGILGANPLFHTPLDRADVTADPIALAGVVSGVRRFVSSFAAMG